MTVTRAPSRPAPDLSPEGLGTLPGEPATTFTYERAAGPIGVLEGIELVGEFKGSGYHEASQLVRRSDGLHVRLSPVLYTVVTVLDRHARGNGAGATEILSRVAEDVRDETGLELTADHIAYLMDQKLAPLGITTNSKGSRPIIAKSQPFLSLRFKRAVLSSSAAWFLGGLFSWLFHPAAVVVGVTAALVSEIWLFVSQPMGSALAQALADPTSVLLVGGLAVASTFFHEIGHATACRYGGVRPGPIGWGVYLVWPVFYTDITNSYQLERSGRLRTDLAGVYFNALVIVGLTLCYVWTGFPVVLAAILIVNIELVQQLLPTLRFDGYYIVSDLVGIPDLFKYIGPILRRTLLRRPADERLQALKPRTQRVVTVWVLVVTPVLIAQLAFVAFQLPDFIAIGWQRIKMLGLNAATSGTDVLQLVGDVTITAIALVPLAGLLVLVMQAVRGVTNIVRNLQKRVGEPADSGKPTSALGDPTSPKGVLPRSVAAWFLLVFSTVLLVIGGAYIVTLPARLTPSETTMGDPVDRPPVGRPPVGRLSLLPDETTSTTALPVGRDGVVQSVIDGDSFLLTNGEVIRLVGIDAPNAYTGECFSAEAKAKLTELLTPGGTVRVVDEVNHPDELGLTLAYVYRLPDGLFVNLTLARDGFVHQAKRTPSDPAYAAELPAAVTEAADSKRGLWSSCPRRSTTSSNRAAPGLSTETSSTGTPPPATPPPATPPPDPITDLVDKLLKLLRGLLGGSQ